MKWLADRIPHLTASEDGPTTVEYAVMLALILMLAVSAAQTLGCSTSIMFTHVANSIGH